MKTTRLAVIVLGVLAIGFAAVWAYAVFPGFKRIPADFSRTDDIAGAYTVVDPIVQRVQSNPAIQQLRASPASMQALADPNVQKVLASDAFRQLLANPAALQGLAADPSAIGKIPDPALRQVLPKLLSDPALAGLVKDPSAVQLAGDPRVMALLADPAALPVTKVPVQIVRERKATKSEGGKLFLSERVATTVAATGEPMPGFPETTATLVIDNRTSKYLEGTDGGRTGYLGFPFDVQADKTYDIYVSAARGPLPARYVKTEDFQGLEVMVFAISEKDRPMGTHPDLKLPLALDSSITLRVEPRSGRVVDMEDHATTISAVHPAKGKLPVFVSDIELSDASVAAQVAQAKADSATLKRLGTQLPLGAAGLGIALAAVGGLGMRGKSPN